MIHPYCEIIVLLIALITYASFFFRIIFYESQPYFERTGERDGEWRVMCRMPRNFTLATREPEYKYLSHPYIIVRSVLRMRDVFGWRNGPSEGLLDEVRVSIRRGFEDNDSITILPFSRLRRVIKRGM